MNAFKLLEEIRAKQRKTTCCGLPNQTVQQFLQSDPLLSKAIEHAHSRLQVLEKEFPELLALSEDALLQRLPEGFLNFYPADTQSPYVPLGAKGPWIISLAGGVIYDTGGYGMLGHGHDPESVRNVLSGPQIMANIMTPSFSQYRFTKKIRSQIGHLRNKPGCPYEKFICMNSGSEGMGVALRITDAIAKKMTDPKGRFEGCTIKLGSLSGSFHGRTTRPARISDSSRKKYLELASYRNSTEHFTVSPNDVSHLRQTFEQLLRDGNYIEVFAIEPVMGEGNPGCAVTREFYDEARRLTREAGAIFIVDSIQAGLRTHGVLSIVDYPGFRDCEPPDIEVFSKALNAGQYPLSVIALREEIAKGYVIGTYGNTMTANPRALDVACKVLDECSPELAANIEARGNEFVEKLSLLQTELNGIITKVQGTGLLVSAELRDDIRVVGFDAAEQKLRKRGINVIHGGANCLRFTPWFQMRSSEISLICSMIKEVLLEMTGQSQAKVCSEKTSSGGASRPETTSPIH